MYTALSYLRALAKENMIMPKISPSSAWLEKLTYPLKALYSKDFYAFILTRMRGIGFVYLLLISAAIAAPASLQVSSILDKFKSLEIVSLVGQLPPSYLNKNGQLSPNDDSEGYKLLYNSKGQPAIVYNTENKALSGDALSAPIELNSSSFVIKSQGKVQTVPYSSLFEVDSTFSPLSAAQSLDMALSSGIATIWSVVTIWFFSILSFNTLITALIAKFLFAIVSGVNLKFISYMRFCSFANTIVAILLLAQYYVSLPISYSVMAMLPLIYVVLTAKEFRRKLRELGPEGFASYLAGNNRSSAFKHSSQPSDENKSGPGSFVP